MLNHDFYMLTLKLLCYLKHPSNCPEQQWVALRNNRLQRMSHMSSVVMTPGSIVKLYIIPSWFNLKYMSVVHIILYYDLKMSSLYYSLKLVL